jgi:serine/threonine protein kinase/WD40 repeat protein
VRDDARPESDSTVDDPVQKFLADLLGRIEAGSITEHEAVRKHPEHADAILRMMRNQQAMASMAPSVPRSLGRFQIQGVVGSGGMGVVLLAHDPDLNRDVAIKTIRPERHSTELVRRFQHEQQILAQLYHTSIVALFAFGTEDGVHYFVMPFIPGATLSAVVAAIKLRPPGASAKGKEALASFVDEARRLTRTELEKAREIDDRRPPECDAYWQSVAEALVQAADAVEHMNGRLVFHRDLKPSNIMFAADGRLSIIDVGLAAMHPRTHALGLDPSLQGVGAANDLALSVTPLYAAPEQFLRIFDARTDVWGLGVVLYELLSLRPAFGHRPALRIDDRTNTLEPPDRLLALRNAPHPKHPREVVRSVPVDLAAICWKAMHPEADDRYQTAADMREDLRRYLRGASVKARPRPVLERTLRWIEKNRWLTSLFIVLAVAVPWIILAQAGENKALYGEKQAQIRETKAQLQKTQAQELATLKAQAEADEQRRQVLLGDLETFIHSDRSSGWSVHAMKRVQGAAAIRKDARLRDAAVATFTGLDAVKIREISDFGASSAAFDSTGTKLALGGSNDYVKTNKKASPAKVWHLDEKQPRTGKAEGPGLVAFQSDGTPIQVSTSLSGEVRVVHILSGETIRPPRRLEPTSGRVAPVTAISENADVIAASFPDGNATVVWSSTGKVHRLPAGAAALAISRDGSLVGVGTGGGEVSVWSAADGRKLASFRVSDRSVVAVAFNRSATLRGDRVDARLAAGGMGRYTVVDAAVGRVVCTFESINEFYRRLTFASDDSMILANGTFFNAGTGEQLLRSTAGEGVAFSPGGREFCVVRSQGFAEPGVHVFTFRPSPGVEILHGLDGKPALIVFARDGRRVAALSYAWKLAVWDVETGTLLRTIDVPEFPHPDNAAIILSADGSNVTAASGEVVCQWDVETGNRIGKWDVPKGFQNCLAYTKQGELLLARTELKSMLDYPSGLLMYPRHPRAQRVRSLKPEAKLQTIQEFDVSPRRTYGLELSADGERLMMSGLDLEGRSCARLFATRSGTLLMTRFLMDRSDNDAVRTDPTGSRMSFASSETTTCVVRSLDGEIEAAEHPAITTLGPNADVFIANVMDPTGRYGVFRRGRSDPILSGIELSGDCVISADGRLVAHATRTGAVALINLPRVEKFLKDHGLDR